MYVISLVFLKMNIETFIKRKYLDYHILRCAAVIVVFNLREQYKSNETKTHDGLFTSVNLHVCVDFLLMSGFFSTSGSHRPGWGAMSPISSTRPAAGGVAFF